MTSVYCDKIIVVTIGIKNFNGTISNYNFGNAVAMGNYHEDEGVLLLSRTR